MRQSRSLFQPILNTTALLDMPSAHILWIHRSVFPGHCKRQKTNPSLFLALRFPCTLHVCSVCACWLRIQIYAFTFKWHPLSILNCYTIVIMVIVITVIISCCGDKIVYFFFLLICPLTHILSQEPLLPSSHSLLTSPDKKSKSHTWRIKSFFKAEHFSV